MSPIHRRQAARRGAARASTWWGKAWVRAVEESAYAEEDLRAARTLARSGRLGPIAVDRGTIGCTVVGEETMPAVVGSLELLPDRALDALVDLVAAEAGRIAALLAGDLPLRLVEHAEEVGVELLPYSGEFSWGCTCDAWLDPCRHALAVGYQLAWLVDADPFVLLGLRGLPRDDLLARLHARGSASPQQDSAPDDVEIAYDAALRARRALQLLAAGAPIDHLL
ncbi:hypothetical protein [Nocardioides bigeumensis]|uniref:SWIM-type domain-containing protein n=1 Tax=Nocardioides bigeumensis TaxID=433657 RepID=A0ABP5KL96_9ACTN